MHKIRLFFFFFSFFFGCKFYLLLLFGLMICAWRSVSLSVHKYGRNEYAFAWILISGWLWAIHNTNSSQFIYCHWKRRAERNREKNFNAFADRWVQTSNLLNTFSWIFIANALRIFGRSQDGVYYETAFNGKTRHLCPFQSIPTWRNENARDFTKTILFRAIFMWTERTLAADWSRSYF